jgi:hypothetical protein
MTLMSCGTGRLEMAGMAFPPGHVALAADAMLAELVGTRRVE